MNARRETVVYLTMTGAEHANLVQKLCDLRDDAAEVTTAYRNEVEALLDGLTAVTE